AGRDTHPGRCTPRATNQDIASELFLSVEAVKTHLRALFAKFGVEDLPQNQQRARLIERASQTGLVSERDLWARHGRRSPEPEPRRVGALRGPPRHRAR